MTQRKIEDRMIFVASCVESVARQLGCSSKEIYQRMKNVDLINNYILKHYETILFRYHIYDIRSWCGIV
jgi:hypothetical protein